MAIFSQFQGRDRVIALLLVPAMMAGVYVLAQSFPAKQVVSVEVMAMRSELPKCREFKRGGTLDHLRTLADKLAGGEIVSRAIQRAGGALSTDDFHIRRKTGSHLLRFEIDVLADNPNSLYVATQAVKSWTQQAVKESEALKTEALKFAVTDLERTRIEASSYKLHKPGEVFVKKSEGVIPEFAAALTGILALIALASAWLGRMNP